MDPNWEPYRAVLRPLSSSSVVKSGGGGEDQSFTRTPLDPRIFGGIHEWSTVCQIPKGKKNIMRINAETAAQKPAESKILFPPAPYKDFEPTYYYCPDDEVKIMNLVKLDSITHPFGFAPCCTKKEHDKKYNEMTDALRFHIERGYMPYFDKTINLNQEMQLNRSVLTNDNKLMRFIGQLGTLAPKVEEFMKALMPDMDFFRQSASNWRLDSLLGCLEFHRALSTEEKIMRSPLEVRQALLSPVSIVRFHVGAQQNFDIGVDGLRNMLEQWDENLSATRWIRILEDYFDVNLFVFTHNMTSRKIDIMRPRCYREFLFPFKEVLRSRKIVFLMEHTSGITNNLLLRYELIVGRSDNQTLLHDFDCYEEYFKLLENAYGSFVGKKKTTIPFLLNSVEHLSKTRPSHQILDCYGKLRVVVYANRFPAVLVAEQAPWALPLWYNEKTTAANLPAYTDTIKFLQEARLDVKHAFVYKRDIVILIVEDFSLLYFITRADKTTPEPPPVTQSNIKPYVFKVIEMMRILLDRDDTLTGNDVLITEDRQRFVNVMRDLCVLRFSIFMKEHLRSMTMHTIPELIETFLQTEVEFRDDVPINIRDLHPRMTNNSAFQGSGRRIIVPRVLETKIKYCLQWYSITKTKEFETFPTLIESPSYYTSVTNFSHRPDSIIQKSLQPFHNRPYDVACQDPIDHIHETPDRLFFYYRPEETPKPEPYLAFLTTDRAVGIKTATLYLTTGIWQSPLSLRAYPPQQQQQQRLPFAERRLYRENSYLWVQVQLDTPSFYIAGLVETDILLLLHPLPRIKKMKTLI
jgi:hypothetical protein